LDSFSKPTAGWTSIAGKAFSSKPLGFAGAVFYRYFLFYTTFYDAQ